MVIYLDNSATTPVRPEVLQAMLPYLQESWGNPSSIHTQGRKAAEAIKTAREQVAALLNCRPDEIYFNSGGTMGNNLGIIGRARFAEANAHGRHLITSRIEHPSVLGPAKHLESLGWNVTYLGVDRCGKVSVDELASAISSKTSIISIMWANNEIGTLQPLDEIAEIARAKEIFMHTDAVQVAGKIKIDLERLPVSALSLSGHKFYAPKGIGVFFLRKQHNVMPITFGGGQEMALFPGTEALPNIVAIGKAASLAMSELNSNSVALRWMQKIICERLSAIIGLHISGPAKLEERLPGHVSFYFPGVESEAIVMRADLAGINISSGSACRKGILAPSSVMKAIGLGDNEAKGAVRISAGRFNSAPQCQEAAERLAKIFTSLAQNGYPAASVK